MNFLSQYNAQIADLCRRYSVERLFAFGSVLTDRFNDESDVDLIVDIADESPLEYADNYFNLEWPLRPFRPVCRSARKQGAPQRADEKTYR